MEEEVLVVSRELFCQVGYFQGFCPDVERYLRVFLSPGKAQFIPRRLAENDPSYKQLIPYAVFVFRDKGGKTYVYQYVRGTGQGERRLHAKRSIGIGGHINPGDQGEKTPEVAYRQALHREVAEEIIVQAPWTERCVGLINDDQTEVGRVHLGVVHLFELTSPAIAPAEPDIWHGGFCPVEELFADLSAFETWSQICLQALFSRA
ncbi:MAG: phosphoesterase [Thermoguttaceae bacterium]|nr:phosphoesterase [Thermoguttaceae bacterium]MDW8077367.1 phosphoesterase [Thermoguttaceae bacterium]